jgi:hypothetical protein
MSWKTKERTQGSEEHNSTIQKRCLTEPELHTVPQTFEVVWQKKATGNKFLLDSG